MTKNVKGQKKKKNDKPKTLLALSEYKKSKMTSITFDDIGKDKFSS